MPTFYEDSDPLKVNLSFFSCLQLLVLPYICYTARPTFKCMHTNIKSVVQLAPCRAISGRRKLLPFGALNAPVSSEEQLAPRTLAPKHPETPGFSV